MLIDNEVEMVWCGGNKQYFIDKGYKFTRMGDRFVIKTTDLKNRASIDVRVKCEVCGEIKKTRYSTYTKCKEKRGIYICGNCSRTQKAKYTVDDIKKILTECDYSLIDDMGYRTMHDKIEIECNMGHRYITEFNCFKQGFRCPICMGAKMVGAGNPRYNHNLTDEQRRQNESRHSQFIYRQWINKILKRDKYTCQLCGHKGKLNAHHLDGYDNFESKRYSVNNGITLCQECHKKFHKIYGYGNNTKSQFENFVKIHANTEVSY